MTKPIKTADMLEQALPARGDLIEKLTQLAEHLNVDPNTGALTIRNGDAHIQLQKDGTIRIEGARIVQHTQKDITLSAAWIDLN